MFNCFIVSWDYPLISDAKVQRISVMTKFFSVFNITLTLLAVDIDEILSTVPLNRTFYMSVLHILSVGK